MNPYDRSLLQAAIDLTTSISSNTAERSCAEKLIFAYDVAHSVPEAARKALFESGALMAYVRPSVFLSLAPLRSVVIRRCMQCSSANDHVPCVD